MKRNLLTNLAINLYKRANDNIFNLSATSQEVPALTHKVLIRNFEIFNKKFDEIQQEDTLKEYLDLFESLVQAYPNSNKNFVWVLSTGRSGTLALNDFLLKSRLIMPFHRNITVKDDLMLYNQFLYTILTGTFETNTPPYLQRLILNYLSIISLDILRAVSSDRQFCFVNNGHTIFAPLIAKFFPSSRFIYLIRDPKSVYLSFLLKHRKPQIEPLAVDPFKLKSLHFNSFSYCHFCQTRPTDLSLNERISWYIYMTNLYASTFLETIDSRRYITINSENLFSQSEEAFEELTKVLNLNDLNYKIFKEHYSTPTNKKTELKRSSSQEEIDRALLIFQSSYDRLSSTGKL
jgi:hypothetical protein